MTEFNVFSCFDGISCGQQALVNASIPYTKYYASEIDHRAIRVTQNRWPKTIQYGDITRIKAHHFMSPIHLLMGGSPCQDLSVAGKGAGLSGARSGLFYQFVRLLNELKPTYFFLENVRMKKVYQDEISRILGVEPIYFDSALVSAQTRKRLYWTNIVSAADFVYPEDRGIVINDILERDKDGYVHEFRGEQHKYRKVEKASNIDANYYKGIDNHQARTCIKVGEIDGSYEKQVRVYSPFGKSAAIDTQSGGDRGMKVAMPVVCMTERRTEEAKAIRRESMKNGKDFSPRRAKELVERTDGKVNCITATQTVEQILKLGDEYRKLTPIEIERCFGFPDNYTKGISNSARYHALGNGWQVDTIVEFFKFLKTK